MSPITRLLDAAHLMTGGDLSARAVVLRRDETGQLARAFNAMAEELASTVDSLEQRVRDRTRNLQTAAEVSHATTSVLNPDELLRQVVDLVRDRFRLYYVGLFLLDEQRRYAILQAGTGRAGQEMLAQGHRREVGDESMIGRCVARGEAQLAFDTGEGAIRFSNPYLPETHSKLTLPLRSRGRVIGGMSVQSTEALAFDEAHVAVMQTVADQVAVAIDNARLFAETETALEEAESTYQRYVRQAWDQYAPTIPSTHYETRRRGAALLGDQVLPEVQQALERQGAVVIAGDGEGQTAYSALVAPITLRGGEVIGALGIHDDEDARQWTRDDIA
ncbi:MAG: GAF domain-containing protein, partial [Delftia sp.]|nr:GAF domain-containing protein [Delftia sp.]